MEHEDNGRGYRFVRQPKGGSGGSGDRRYFQITAAEGTSPPFVYSAVEVARNNTTHAFATKSGGVTVTANLFNIAETEYPGAGKIPIGQTVEAWHEGTEWLCEVLSYRGVYPSNG